MTKVNFNKLKEKFGKVASWAIWDDQVKSVDWAKDETELLDKLNTRYVFIGLNPSKQERDEFWTSFHNGRNDHRLQAALTNHELKGEFEGCYITDLIKRDYDPNAGNVADRWNTDEKLREDNLRLLQEELELLGYPPVLIAIGETPTYRFLRKCNLGNENYHPEVYMIVHYSTRCPKYRDIEVYKNTVKAQLEEISRKSADKN